MERTRVYVAEREKLIYNARIIQNQAGGVPVWAVVKGNGYGLGLVPMVQVLYEEGIRRFCITELWEAQSLCREGWEQLQILMLQPTQDKEVLRELLALHVICTVSCLEDAMAVNEVAGEMGISAKVHLKVDTGMGRYGFLPSEKENILSVYGRMEHLYVTGIYTHFSCASCRKKKTQEQFRRFLSVIETVKENGYDPGERHCCNSAAFFRFPHMHLDSVRIGSAWLGRVAGNYGLQPVGHCESCIEEFHWVLKGQTTGYGGIWKAKHPTKLAIVPVGWYHGLGVTHNRNTVRFRDGLRWFKAWVCHKGLWAKVNGQDCPVRGRVGMLCTAVDVSQVSCQVGDLVTIEISPLMQKEMEVVFR